MSEGIDLLTLNPDRNQILKDNNIPDWFKIAIIHRGNDLINKEHIKSVKEFQICHMNMWKDGMIGIDES
jgi:hypothetical protein